jgi:hypothetical protein
LYCICRVEDIEALGERRAVNKLMTCSIILGVSSLANRMLEIVRSLRISQVSTRGERFTVAPQSHSSRKRSSRLGRSAKWSFGLLLRRLICRRLVDRCRTGFYDLVSIYVCARESWLHVCEGSWQRMLTEERNESGRGSQNYRTNVIAASSVNALQRDVI